MQLHYLNQSLYLFFAPNILSVFVFTLAHLLDMNRSIIPPENTEKHWRKTQVEMVALSAWCVDLDLGIPQTLLHH